MCQNRRVCLLVTTYVLLKKLQRTNACKAITIQYGDQNNNYVFYSHGSCYFSKTIPNNTNNKFDRQAV